MQKKKTTTQHNTQNKKTKQRKREKDQIFILMRSFLSKDIPVFYELTSIYRNGFVYFEKWSIFNFS